MDLDEAKQLIFVDYLKQDIDMLAEEIVYERKDKERIKLFKALMRTMQYYSKYHDFKAYRETLNYVPEEYFPK